MLMTQTKKIFQKVNFLYEENCVNNKKIKEIEVETKNDEEQHEQHN